MTFSPFATQDSASSAENTIFPDAAPGLDGKPAKKPAGAADSGDEDDEDDAGAAGAEEEEEDEDEKLLEEMDELRRVLSSHRSPYDRVGVVNADP